MLTIVDTFLLIQRVLITLALISLISPFFLLMYYDMYDEEPPYHHIKPTVMLQNQGDKDYLFNVAYTEPNVQDMPWKVRAAFEGTTTTMMAPVTVNEEIDDNILDVIKSKRNKDVKMNSFFLLMNTLLEFFGIRKKNFYLLRLLFDIKSTSYYIDNTLMDEVDENEMKEAVMLLTRNQTPQRNTLSKLNVDFISARYPVLILRTNLVNRPNPLSSEEEFIVSKSLHCFAAHHNFTIRNVVTTSQYRMCDIIDVIQSHPEAKTVIIIDSQTLVTNVVANFTNRFWWHDIENRISHTSELYDPRSTFILEISPKPMAMLLGFGCSSKATTRYWNRHRTYQVKDMNNLFLPAHSANMIRAKKIVQSILCANV